MASVQHLVRGFGLYELGAALFLVLDSELSEVNTPSNARPAVERLGLVTRQELAQLWRCTPQTASRQAAARGLKPVKIGRLTRYRISDVERWMDAECSQEVA